MPLVSSQLYKNPASEEAVLLFQREDCSSFDAQTPISAFTICVSSRTQASEEQFMLMEVIIQKL